MARELEKLCLKMDTAKERACTPAATTNPNPVMDIDAEEVAQQDSSLLSQKEQGMAFTPVATGFEVDHMSTLLSIAECFGASLLIPFKVLAKVRKVAYRLELPQELSRVHHTFHVSNPKKCYADEPLVMPLEGIHVDDRLRFKEEPVEIME
nr:putative reverse transcriptase domain-containing protein [Tanacetum cinerariifolium]